MEKYHVSSLIQDFVFASMKMFFIRCISSQVYNKYLGSRPCGFREFFLKNSSRKSFSNLCVLDMQWTLII